MDAWRQGWIDIISFPISIFSGEIDLTVSVIRYRTRNGLGNLRYGVCSTWLNSIAAGELIHCFVRR